MSSRTSDPGEETGGSFWSAPQREGILISDLSVCEPQSAVLSKPKEDCWYTLPYETKDGIKGVLLGKGALASPPDATLDLEPRGWHAIYLGVYRGGIAIGKPFHDPCLLKVKLSDDDLFDMVRPSVEDRPALNTVIPGSENSIEEFFWKASELGGQSLVMSYPRAGVQTAAHLAFVRLVPMTDEEVAEYRQVSGGQDTKVLAAQYDGGSAHDYVGVETVEDLLELHEPWRDTDVGKLFLGTGAGGSMWYPTKVSEMEWAWDEVHMTEQARGRGEALRGYASQGVDIVKTQVDHVHSMGIEVYLGFRMGGPMAAAPPGGRRVPFWRDHPEWRCRDRDGDSITRLSMAYPEVRKFYVDLFLELADYGVEGVQLINTRRPPFVLFEPPVIEDFKKEYGVDPRELPVDLDGHGRLKGATTGLDYPHDERLERHWAKYVTTFMRELREALDSKRRPDGGRLGIVANVLGDAAYNRSGGLDLETWAREGLADILVATPSGSQPVDYEYFRKATEGTDCVFYEDILPLHKPPKDYIDAARRAYGEGAAGLAFWDTDRRSITKSQWNTVRRLGHREELDKMEREGADYLMHQIRLIEDWNPSSFM